MADSFARMRQLVGTTAEWTANDLIIGNGEFAVERLGGGGVRLKLGNGVDFYSVLPYFDPGIFDYVLRDGDTMTGPLVVPEITVQGPATVQNGLTVTAGTSSFDGPVDLGNAATTAEPTSSADNDTTVPTTHWVQQQIGGVISGLNLKGTWNAATNTPALASGGAGVPPPVRGDFYIVSVSGTTNLDGISTWNQGDSVVFNGVSWQRVPQTLGYDQIVAGLGYTPADDADLTTLEADAIKRQIVDAAGDLIVGTAADTVARLAKGTEGQALTVSGGNVQWASGALRLYSEQTCVGGETQMNVTIPANARRIELEWTYQAASGDPSCALQSVEGGTPNATANHVRQVVHGSGSTAGAVGSGALTAWDFGGVNRATMSLKMFPLVGGNWAGVGTLGIITAALVRQVQAVAIDGGATPATTTGFRLTVGNSFLANSFLRCFVAT